MKKALLLSSIICLLITIIYGIRWQKTIENQGIVTPGNDGETSLFAEYDFERLRDPVTNQIPPGIRERELAYTSTLPSTSDFNTLMMRQFFPMEQQRIELTNLRNYGIEQTGGRTRAFAIDVTNRSVLLAGAVNGGVWRSTDAGATWRKTIQKTGGHSVSCIVQDTRKGKEHIWYYGTGEVLGTAGYPIYNYDIGEGIFKSIDSGKTWSKLMSTAITRGKGPRSPFSLVTELAVDVYNQNQDVVYCGGAGSIQRSEDGGETWTTVLGSATEFTASLAQVIVKPGGVVYASIGGTPNNPSVFCRSSDGKSFTGLEIPGISSFSNFSRAVIASSPSEPNTIWTLVRNSTNGTMSLLRYKYKSGDGSGNGGEWYSAPNANISFYINTLNGFCQSLAVHPTKPNTLVVGGQDLYITSDAGQTFRQIGGYQEGILQGREFDPTLPTTWLHPNHHPDIHSFAFDPVNPDIMYNANDGGIYRTKNLGENAVWEPLNNGYNVAQFYSIDIDKKGIDKTAFVAGAQDNNAVVGRAGKSDIMKWVLSGDGLYCSMPSGGKVFFPATQMGQVHRVDLNANDSVVNWTNIAPPANFSFFARPEISRTNDSAMFLLDRNSLWANNNIFGIPVTKSRQGTTVNWRTIPVTFSASMTVLGQCVTVPDRLYIGMANGRLLRVEEVWSPTPTVKEIRPPNFHPLAYISCIHVDPKNSDILTVAISNYSLRSVFHSTDGGETFTDVSGNLEPPVADDFYAGPSVRWIESQRTPNGIIYYAGTSSGLFYTTKLDGNSTQWIRIDEIGDVVVNMLKVRDEDGFVAVATHGLGVFTFNASLIGASTVESTPESFCSRVFPNPSQGMFNLTLSEDIEYGQTLSIIDSRGQRVHEQTLSGSKGDDIDISLEHLPSGAYFALLNNPRKSKQHLMQKLIIR
jgi:photosystem II stability/assembly factor-like uncharacterized protein